MKILALALLLAPAALHALTPGKLIVEDVTRTFLLHTPEGDKTKPAPLIFAFHGHGGGMTQAAKSFHLHTAWPEAVVVYPQGLNTPGQLTDPEGKKPGWQSQAGILGDRDLKFFDALLAHLKATHPIDPKRIYSTGHSNGGGFTYLLWAERYEVFAAMAPSASAGLKSLPRLKPKPALHIAATNDPLVKYAWQSRMIEALKGINGCSSGQAWELEPHCTLYPSATGTPLITALHEGGHKYPPQAPAVIVKFFQAHAQK
jgi:polyhydroxybutyrate depolymerase